MLRILVRSANVAVAALILGFAGCGGGGVEEGVPKDLTPAADINSVKLMPTKGTGAPSTTPPKDVTPPKN